MIVPTGTCLPLRFVTVGVCSYNLLKSNLLRFDLPNPARQPSSLARTSRRADWSTSKAGSTVARGRPRTARRAAASKSSLRRCESRRRACRSSRGAPRSGDASCAGEGHSLLLLSLHQGDHCHEGLDLPGLRVFDGRPYRDR